MCVLLSFLFLNKNISPIVWNHVCKWIALVRVMGKGMNYNIDTFRKRNSFDCLMLTISTPTNDLNQTRASMIVTASWCVKYHTHKRNTSFTFLHLQRSLQTVSIGDMTYVISTLNWRILFWWNNLFYSIKTKLYGTLCECWIVKTNCLNIQEIIAKWALFLCIIGIS